MKKIMSTAALALVVGASLTACGGNTAQTEQKPAAQSSAAATANAPVKLRIAWWGSQERHDATQKAIALYSQKNPNVTFESEFSGWDGYFDKLGVQFSAKNAPDIIQMDAAYLNEYVGRNLLADLNSVNVADIDKSLIESGKVGGKLYAMPLGSAAFGMTVDKSVVDKLGLKVPDFGWTWDDYYKFGQEAKAKLGKDKYVFVDQSGDLYDYTAYQLSMGKGQVFTDNKLTIDKDTWIGYMKKQDELRKAGIVTPPNMTVTDKELDPKLDSVVNGNALARHIFSASVGAINGLKPDSYSFTSLPKAVQTGGWLKPGMFWSVNASSKQQEEAKKFVDWFINDLEAAKVLGLSRGIPGNSKVVAALSPNFSASDKTSQEFINKVAPDAQKFVAEPQGWGNFKKDYKTIVEKIMFSKSTPEQAYEELMKKAKEYDSVKK
ncbi:ABC transporter substrate-binding protein [Paenibacillus sedimenti]|uniref:Carbohydrate ABC transporter substrate-binding protein n=1 Tax=Paenibacillus sedimenti TaxID=2770274 RepID=A0A926KYW4_9BACL|nr:ABC transporter substrate-binding protein [Paenibacillus sedimenti]MBD0384773.1 carbohydrate ABC transporter substrate-binding protein [Paenibacillus sedimenti]